MGRYWRRLSYETKSAVLSAAAVIVLAAGLFASLGVTSLERGGSEAQAEGLGAETLTVERTFTVSGVRTVVKSVRVVPRSTNRSADVLGTAVELRTVTTPGGREIVTVPARARTLVETRQGGTRTNVVTNERVVTDRQVVTNERVVTNDRVVTNERTITDVQTVQVTVPVTTVRTVTDTVPVTQTLTTTQVVTETVVSPPATVTVTVTCPPKGCG